MEEEKEKFYCGKAKLMNGKFGDFWGVNLCLTDIPEEHVRTLDNGSRYVNLKIVELRQPDDRGNTHTVFVDTWKPDGSRQSSQPRSEQPRARQSTQAPQMQYSAPRQTVVAGPEMFDSDQIPF